MSAKSVKDIEGNIVPVMDYNEILTLFNSLRKIAEDNNESLKEEISEKYNELNAHVVRIDYNLDEMINGSKKLEDVMGSVINVRNIRSLSTEDKFKAVLEIPYEERTILLIEVFSSAEEVWLLSKLVKDRGIKFSSISQYYDRLMITMFLTNMLLETKFKDFDDTVNIFMNSFPINKSLIYDTLFAALLKINDEDIPAVDENLMQHISFFDTKDLRSRLAISTTLKHFDILYTYFGMQTN